MESTNDDGTNKSCPLSAEFAISDPTAAREVSALMLDFAKKLEQSAELVHTTWPVDEWKAYKKAAASIYIEMFLYVLGPLYKKHPSLKPPDWDDAGKE